MNTRKLLTAVTLIVSLLLNSVAFVPQAAIKAELEATSNEPMPGLGAAPVAIVDDFEDGLLPFANDSFGNGIGFVTWGSANNTTLITKTVAAADPLALPQQPGNNILLQVDYNIASGGWGGFTHAFENESVDTWVSQDWSPYAGIGFWFYGANSGGEVNFDIFDNRTTTGDSCERFTYIFTDNFTGWRYFQIPFADFARKGWQPGGAPNDGLTLTEVWGYAFGFPAAVGAQTNYLDNIGLMLRQTVIDDFEDGLLSLGKDGDNNDIGFVTWGSAANTTLFTTTVAAADPLALPYQAGDNILLRVNYNIASGGWGGFTHAFENEAVDTWVSQDWSTYEGISFWLYGTGSGGMINIDLFDNRTTTGDSCERFTYEFYDNFTGWRYFELPFTSFTRKSWQPGGAPNDGLTLTEMWGYAFGFPAAVGARVNYIDNVIIYGNTAVETELKVAFSKAEFNVIEGNVATIAVSLNMTSTDTITVSYSTAPGTATVDRDYTPASGELVFPPDTTEQTFTVATIDDTKYEGKETVLLALSDPVNVILGTASAATLNIQEDDPFDPGLIDDFETFPYEMETWGDVEIETNEIAAGDPMALPGQGPFENVLHATSNIAAGESGGFGHILSQSADWSKFQSFSFWYYGQNSGDTVKVQILDNKGSEAGPESWELAWHDEFTGPAGAAPDATKWGYDIGGWGWGNNELEYYTDRRENSALNGAGALVITATTENTATTTYQCHYGPCEYTSARLLTLNKFAFTYGRAEARLKLPYGQGIWPAFWSLGNNFQQVGWPNSGEIDIMENIGREPNIVHGTVHGPGYSGGSGIGGGYTYTEPLSNNYHVYAIEWEPEEIRWYIDDVQYLTVTPADLPAGTEWVFDHPFFLIMNVAVGGYWPGYPDATSTFPQNMLVDYVRVYQSPNNSERFESAFVDNFSGWQQVTIPFADFTRSLEQPDGAPNDGLNLTEAWGYLFTLPEGNGEIYVDQVRVAGAGPVLDDFESGLSSEYVVWGDFEWNPGTTTAIALSLVDMPMTNMPAAIAQDPNTVLKVDYVVAPGMYGGFSRDFSKNGGVSQDWSGYDALKFWMYGNNTGDLIYIDIFDNRALGSTTDTAERFSYEFVVDNFTGWKYFSIPFTSFVRKGWQPDGAPNDGLTLTEMWGFAFGFPGGSNSTIYLDDILLADAADLAITKTRVGTGNVNSGDPITFNLSVVNLGPTDPVVARVVDTWSPVEAVVAVNAPEFCDVYLAQGVIECTIDNLGTTQAMPFPIVLTTAADYIGPLTNVANVAPTGGVVDLVMENNTASVNVDVGHIIFLPLVMRNH